MAKPEWGVKRLCRNCGARFYDFNKSPIICPSCDTEFVIEQTAKPKKEPKQPKPEKKKAPVKEAKDIEEIDDEDSDDELEDIDLGDDLEIDIDEDDDEDALIEDASDLDDPDSEEIVPVKKEAD